MNSDLKDKDVKGRICKFERGSKSSHIEKPMEIQKNYIKLVFL